MSVTGSKPLANCGRASTFADNSPSGEARAESASTRACCSVVMAALVAETLASSAVVRVASALSASALALSSVRMLAAARAVATLIASN
ncbi:hypothetical protein D9M70_327630 [compost metagenome]